MDVSKAVWWSCCGRRLDLHDRPLLMGILNVTPDSFSDGGKYLSCDAAVAHGVALAEEGADIVDVGGESTRPGAAPVSAAEESRRVVPVIRELAQRVRALISVDTTKAEVARQAMDAGAAIINDVSALKSDAGMAGVAMDRGAGVVLMHMKGTPGTMQQDPRYGNVTEEVAGYLEARVRELSARGLDPETLAVDPGIGFGKTVDHNLQLLRELPRLAACGRPVVVGVSRKSFIGKITGADAEDRLPGSLAAMLRAAMSGGNVFRVHDVKASRQALDLLLAIERRGK